MPYPIFGGLCIHLLTLLLLYHFDYEVGRYISLERIFEESKESYYETLEKSSHGWHQAKHNLMPWMTYFWGVLLRAYKEFEGRVGTLTTGKGNSDTLPMADGGVRIVLFTSFSLYSFFFILNYSLYILNIYLVLL